MLRKLYHGVSHENSRGRKQDTLACIVHEVKLAPVAIHDLADCWVTPQLADGQGELLGKAEVGTDGEV